MLDHPSTRILIITRNLPPLVGGMERLNWHMAEELAKRADVRIIGPEGAAALAPSGVRLYEAPLKPLLRFLLAAQWRALREARAWKPHIILAGSGVTAPLAWLAAKICGARAAVYVHGLDLTVRQPVYRRLWLPAIRRMDRVIANSRATEKIAIDVGVKPDCISIVHPGVDLPDSASIGSSFRHKPKSSASAADGPTIPELTQRFRAEHALGDRPLLLSVGRLTRRKGMREFVADVLPRIVASQPNVLLLIVGDAPTAALHAEAQTPDSIQHAADAVGVGDHIRFLGVITDRVRLATVYQSADVHVFPVQHIPDDPEGFGMVAVEAAAHGLPTVAYATGGVIDAIAENQSGHLVASGDIAGFAQAVISLLDQPIPQDQLLSHAKFFAWECFGADLWSQLPGASPATDANHK